jgi:threonine aldolase
MIDFRSDTVTKPTPEMRKAMAEAIVGDDVYGEDTTIQLLESTVAQMFHKESALFFPSGTMSNLTALLTWCPKRGSEFIIGDNSHMFLFEQAGASQFGGISPRTVPNLPNGEMDLNQIKLAIRDDDIHEPSTQLICIENTHNACGGKVLSMDFMQKLKELGDSHNIPIHLDGARIWNALTLLKKIAGVEPHDIGNHVSSLSVCLSKGLGAPIGSLLVGSEDFIKRARRIRKALGGGMRQVGILGAAGLQAIEDFKNGILVNDHKRAFTLAHALRNLTSIRFHDFQTNIIFADILLYDKKWNCGQISSNISTLLKENGIYVSAWSPLLIRMVIHRDISDEDIEKTIKAFKELEEYLCLVNN